MKGSTIVIQGKFNFQLEEDSKIEEDTLEIIATEIKNIIDHFFDTQEYLEYLYRGYNSGMNIEGIVEHSIKSNQLKNGDKVSLYYHGQEDDFNLELLAKEISFFISCHFEASDIDFRKLKLWFYTDTTYFNRKDIQIVKRMEMIKFERIGNFSSKYDGVLGLYEIDYPDVNGQQMNESSHILCVDVSSINGVLTLAQVLQNRLKSPSRANPDYDFDSPLCEELASDLIRHVTLFSSESKDTDFELDTQSLRDYIDKNTKERLFLGEKDIMELYNELAPRIAFELMQKGNLKTDK